VAGVERSPVVFLFTDSQIVNEGFVEDINSILNAGDVPNLFPPDEKDRIISDVREYAASIGKPVTHFLSSHLNLFYSSRNAWRRKKYKKMQK
jgi:dynein heavy chain, axonemal